MKKDHRIDKYILKSAEFAEPILEHIRSLIHKNCPDAEETMKWSFPHFIYKGEILCSMASFKNHCAFGFWKASLIPELEETVDKNGESAMGHFGKIQSLKNLPSDKIFSSYIKKAMKLTDDGVKKPAVVKSPKDKVIEVPDYFMKVLKKNKKALKVFESFSYSHKKEYLEWIMDAKREETRNSRMEKTIKQLSEGKDLNYKYK